MPEEPEEVLPQDGTAVVRVEDLRAEAAVGTERDSAEASGGNAISTRRLVTSVFQVKIGMRNMVMPGARMQMIVVMKLTAPRIVPKPPRARPNTHKSPPSPGLNVVLDSGA